MVPTLLKTPQVQAVSLPLACPARSTIPRQWDVGTGTAGVTPEPWHGHFQKPNEWKI
jgi:hypothetical protein